MAAMALQPAADKLALVQKGELKTVHASWWGFNSEDSTEALIQAINSKAPQIIIDKMEAPWITAKTLLLPSDIEIIFEEGAELQAKRGEFKGKGDCLVKIHQSRNVTIRGLGKGATLRMHKKDYHSDAYENSEWRHCISLSGSHNISISNLKLLESGGDGIYFGVTATLECSTEVTVKNVICDGNNRQGISVIGGVNCLVEDCQFINTSGTPPAAGIDFEPNRPGEHIDNFILRNCFSGNNLGCGYLFSLGNFTAPSGSLNITLENCRSNNDKGSALVFYKPNGAGRDTPGKVLIKNCTFENNAASIIFNGSCANGFKTVFENVELRNIASNTEKAPIQFGYAPHSTGLAGNILFKNVNVYDTIDRDPFEFINGGTTGGLEKISGKITSYIDGKPKRKMVFSNRWAKKNFPQRKLKLLPAIDITGMKFTPVSTNAISSDKQFSPIRQRGIGTWKVLLQPDDTLEFTAAYEQLGRYQGTFAKVVLTTPSGKSMRLGDVPFKESKTFTVNSIKESGLYTLSIYAENQLSRIIHCNRPIVIPAYPTPVHICKGTGELFFYVPKGTKEFVAQFIGETLEGVKATVFAPDGSQVWQMDDIARLEQYECSGKLAKQGGIFRVLLEPPTHIGVLEDYYICLTGIPAFFALTPEHLIQQEK